MPRTSAMTGCPQDPGFDFTGWRWRCATCPERRERLWSGGALAVIALLNIATWGGLVAAAWWLL